MKKDELKKQMEFEVENNFPNGDLWNELSDKLDELEKNKLNYIVYDSNSNDIIADCSTLDGLYEYAEKTRLELIESNFSYDIKPPMIDEERLEILKTIFS